jgi:hypothetical protein
MSEEQSKLVNHCVFYASKARQFAAQGDYDVSLQLFAVAQRHSQDERLDRQSQLLSCAEINAAEAYLDFVTGDFAGARKRLFTAMAADEALECEFGHTNLHVHRIHLANNVVKVEAGARNLSGALELAARILEYVHGRSESIPLPTSWGVKWQASLSRDPRSFLLRQTTAEVACAMAGVDSETGWEAWTDHMDNTEDFYWTEDVADVREWYPVKSAYLRCDHLGSPGVAVYSRLASEYLAAGTRNSRLLWDAVALDAVLVSAGSHSPGAQMLRTQAGGALREAGYLPRHVRSVIERSVTGMEQDYSEPLQDPH